MKLPTLLLALGMTLSLTIGAGASTANAATLDASSAATTPAMVAAPELEAGRVSTIAPDLEARQVSTIAKTGIRIPIPGMRQGTVEVNAKKVGRITYDVTFSVSTAARGYLLKHGASLLALVVCSATRIPKLICGPVSGIVGELVYHYMQGSLGNRCFVNYVVRVNPFGVKSITPRPGRCH